MGVHGLWRLLESTGKPINPETLEGKVLAVDISIWLNQAVKGVRDRHGNNVQNSHLLTLFHRVCKLLFFRIKPVFVFDGDPPLLKKQTLARRRQRKEELTSESKQTNEKLLKNFLKRQAIKAALGDRSKDPLPSLSTVRRNEVDDMYVLPALPPVEEKEQNSSEEEEEEREQEEMIDSYQDYQVELIDNPNSVDINSEDFTNLPPEMKHEILKDMKEFAKRRRTLHHKPPERSSDFSQYQLAGLLQRNHLNQRLEGVEREMSQRSAGCAPELCQQDGDQQSHSVESQRLVSEDYSHYILIKGSKKNENTAESQPAALPWSGEPLSGSKARKTDRPEPLWRPISEEDEAGGPSLVSKPKETSPPPSPRTLRAIQAAMSDGSDEETENLGNNDGEVSPRTLRAIQTALMQDADNATEISSRQEPLVHIQLPVPQTTISSDEDKEAECKPGVAGSSNGDRSQFQGNVARPRLRARDQLLASSSEDEMAEVIEHRNRALLSAGQRQPQDTERTDVTESKMKAQGEKLNEPKNEEPENLNCEEAVRQEAVVFDRRLPFLPTQVNETIMTDHHTEPRPSMLDPKCQKSPELKEETKGNMRKSSGESESEESFIEVSEDEVEEEEEDASESHRGIKPQSSEEGQRSKQGDKEERIAPPPAFESEEDESVKSEEEDEPTGSKEAESRSPTAPNEWEDCDFAELEALDSSLQEEQSSLKEQKQQQERMATTVTGQMYLESQELLRLFGIPFLVAPTEAEAQCAALDRADQTHGTITDDSDVWLFGGRHVYKNFFSQNKYVEHYQCSDLQNQLGLDRAKMINLAYLLGSDYTDGVPGVGHVTGMEVLNEFPGPGLEPLVQFSQWWSEAQQHKRLVSDPRDSKVKKKLRKLELVPGFPNPAVAQAYLHPSVDQSEGSFSWGRPQLDMIKEFCLSRFGWTWRKTDETLQPVMKQLNSQQTQLRIDSFFRMEQQEKQAIRSQRLRRAVICMKRKEREGGRKNSDGSEEEEEVVSPIKPKRGRAASQTQKNGEKQEVAKVGGGFLGSQCGPEAPVRPQKEVSQEGQQSPVPAKCRQAPESEPAPQGKRSSSSDSSDEDDDTTSSVAMVRARSVFEGKGRGRGAKHTRGRGRGRGKGKKVAEMNCGLSLIRKLPQ